MPRVKKMALPSVPIPVQWQAEISDHVIALAWSPDGRWLAAAAVSGPISLFDSATGQLTAVLAGHHLGTTSLSWHADSRCLASAGQDGLVRLWDVATGYEQHTLEAGSTWVEHVAWSPTGALLATAAGRTLRLWHATGRLQQQYPAHASTIAALQWAPRTVQVRRASSVLATAAYGSVTLWTPERSEPLAQFAWKGSILTLAWSPDGRYLVHGDQDATVHFWVLASGQDSQMWGYPTKVRELAWDHTSRYLATGGGLVVVVWDYAGKGPKGSKPLMLEAHEDFLSFQFKALRGDRMHRLWEQLCDPAPRLSLFTLSGPWPLLAIVGRGTSYAAHACHVGEDKRFPQATASHACTTLARPALPRPAAPSLIPRHT